MRIFWFDKQEKTAAGGMGTYSREIINSLTQKGHQVFPLRFGDRPESSDPKNTVLLPYSLGDKAIYMLPTTKTFKIVKETFEKEKPDIAHINFSISPLDFYLPRLAQKKNVAVVGTIHQGFPESPRLTLGNVGVKSYFISHLSCVSQLDKLFVFSTAVKEFLISLGVNGRKIEVFPNFADCQTYAPGKSIFKEKNKIKFAYLFLGRINRQKNPDILVESFLKIKPPPEQKLIIVGSGDRGSTYTNLLKNYKGHPQIIFTGPKKDINEKVDIIRAADVFVLPSLFEGMSFALLESMACGLAPIVSDAGNHAEVVGNSGMVIENDKVKDQLPIALQVFAKNPDLAKILGRKAREKVLKNYNQAAQINKLIEIYQEVINQRKAQKPKANFLTSFLTTLHKNF